MTVRFLGDLPSSSAKGEFSSQQNTYFPSVSSKCISKTCNCIYCFFFPSSEKVKQTVLKKATKPVSSASLRSCRRPVSTEKPVSASSSSCRTQWCLPHLPAKTAALTTPGCCTTDSWVWGTTAPAAPRHPPASSRTRNRHLWTCGDPGDRTRAAETFREIQQLCTVFICRCKCPILKCKACYWD